MAQSVGRLRGLHPVVDTRDWVYAGAKKVLKVAQRAPMEVSLRPRPWTVQRRLPAACWETFSAWFGPQTGLSAAEVGSFFDEYLMVDWSAANQPKQGSDSIWLSHGRWLPSGGLDSGSTWNPASRDGGDGLLERIAGTCVLGGRRILVGFDFAFSYPTGLRRPSRNFPAAPVAGHLVEPRRGHRRRLVWPNQQEQSVRCSERAEPRHENTPILGESEGARYQGLAYLPMDLQHLPPGLQPDPLLSSGTPTRGNWTAGSSQCGNCLGVPASGARHWWAYPVWNASASHLERRSRSGRSTPVSSPVRRNSPGP